MRNGQMRVKNLSNEVENRGDIWNSCVEYF
jgi:hypothetical protein